MENKQESTKTTDSSNEIARKKKIIHNVMHTISPAFFVENCFGIFRYRVTDNDFAPTNIKLKILSFIIISVFVGVFAAVIRLPDAINGTGKILEVMDEVPSIVIIVQYVSSTLRTSCILSGTNIRLFKTIADLDFKLHADRKPNFYKKARRVTIVCVLVLVIFHVIVGTCDVLTETYKYRLSRLGIVHIYLEQNLELSVFCLLIWMLLARLEIINDYLAIFIKDKETKISIFLVKDKKSKEGEFNFIGRPSPENMRVRDLAVAYDIIGETCGLINDVFTFQIFMTLAATFTYIVITIWTSIQLYRGPGQDYDALIPIIIWCVTNVMAVGLMSLICERLLVTRNETKVLVNKLIMDYELPKSMRVQAKAFMELIEAWRLRIFIYDMFSVDISLMLKFISVATTYLIVIIQITHFL